MKNKVCTALRVQFSDSVAILFPQGSVAFGNIISEEDDSVLATIMVKMPAASGQRLGDCEVVRFGVKDSKEPDRICQCREVSVVYRESEFILPSSAKGVKCGGFKFGGKIITAIKQFVRSYEGL